MIEKTLFPDALYSCVLFVRTQSNRWHRRGCMLYLHQTPQNSPGALRAPDCFIFLWDLLLLGPKYQKGTIMQFLRGFEFHPVPLPPFPFPFRGFIYLFMGRQQSGSVSGAFLLFLRPHSISLIRGPSTEPGTGTRSKDFCM